MQLLQSAKCQFDSMAQHTSSALMFSNPLNTGSTILALEGWSACLLVGTAPKVDKVLSRVLSIQVLNIPSDADYGLIPAHSSTWLFTLWGIFSLSLSQISLATACDLLTLVLSLCISGNSLLCNIFFRRKWKKTGLDFFSLCFLMVDKH